MKRLIPSFALFAALLLPAIFGWGERDAATDEVRAPDTVHDPAE